MMASHRHGTPLLVRQTLWEGMAWIHPAGGSRLVGSNVSFGFRVGLISDPNLQDRWVQMLSARCELAVEWWPDTCCMCRKYFVLGLDVLE